MQGEREEIQAKNAELDEEISEYQRQINSEEAKLFELNEKAKALSAEVDEKESELLQLEDEQPETIERIVPEAHVECEVSNFS